MPGLSYRGRISRPEPASPLPGAPDAPGPGPAGKGGSLGFCDPYHDPRSQFQGRENARSPIFMRLSAIVARIYASINRIRALAQELVGLQPDIILASTTPATVALQRETRTIPIVFANGGDPVASGIVPRLSRPSGNITGFASLEATLAGKWLEFLSEIAPRLKRAAIMFNPDFPAASVFMPAPERPAAPVCQ